MSNQSAFKPAFVTRQQAGEVLSVDVQTISKMIKQGRLQAYYVGRCVRIRLDDLLTNGPEPYDPDHPRGDVRRDQTKKPVGYTHAMRKLNGVR